MVKDDVQEFQISASKSKYKVKTFTSSDLSYLENQINKYIGEDNKINILDIKYQAFKGVNHNGIDQNIYTAMLQYMEG